MAEPDLMTPEELAAQLRMAPKTLRNMRARRQGPPYLKINGGAVRYDRQAINEWLKTQRAELAAG